MGFAGDPTSSAYKYCFGLGELTSYGKTSPQFVRAVRGTAETFGTRLQNNGNGTVCDLDSGLMWHRTTSSTKRTWQSALQYCEDSTLAGYTDWRLPDVNELVSIADYSLYDPALRSPLSGYSANYFSSTTYPSSSALWAAWAVNFKNGEIYYAQKTQTNYVRCVRTAGCSSAPTSISTTTTTVATTSSSSSTSSVSSSSTTTSVQPTSTTTAAPTTTTTAAPADTDGDGFLDGSDNCLSVRNPDQLDADHDTIGDCCDGVPNCGGCGQASCDRQCGPDSDGDGKADTGDNCPAKYNPDQLDADRDGSGDCCDTQPGCGGCGQPVCDMRCAP